MSSKQTILIAGSTGNIGGGAALALAKRGARIVLLGRKLETLQAKADFIRVALSEDRIVFHDTDIATLVVDFTDMESVKHATAEAMNLFPTIDGLMGRRGSRPRVCRSHRAGRSGCGFRRGGCSG